MLSVSAAARFYEPELFDHQLDHDWICSICSLVVRKPLDLVCGHLFCFECLHHWRGDNKNNTCPICRHVLPPPGECKINQFVTKKVWRMTVHCCNSKAGCPATVTLGEEGCNMASHVASCPYERIPCQDCKMHLFRRDFPEHTNRCELRIVQCPSCNGSFKQHELFAHQKHPLGCSFLVQCPNACQTTDTKGILTTTIIRISEKELHIAECPLESVCCELCGQSIERRGLKSHMAELTSLHFAGLHNENKTLRTLLNKVQAQIAWLKADVAILNTRVGRKMRIRDSVGKWCLAYVIAISGSKARVHFINFDSKWDEDIDFASEPYRFTRSGELCKVHNPYRIGQIVSASWRLNGATGQHPLTGAITCIDDCQIQIDNRMWYHVLETDLKVHHPSLNSSLVIQSSLYDSSKSNLTTSLSSSHSSSISASESTFPSPSHSPPLVPQIPLSPSQAETLSVTTTSISLSTSSSSSNFSSSPTSSTSTLIPLSPVSPLSLSFPQSYLSTHSPPFSFFPFSSTQSSSSSLSSSLSLTSSSSLSDRKMLSSSLSTDSKDRVGERGIERVPGDSNERKHDLLSGMELLPLDRERTKRLRDSEMIHFGDEDRPRNRRRNTPEDLG